MMLHAFILKIRFLRGISFAFISDICIFVFCRIYWTIQVIRFNKKKRKKGVKSFGLEIYTFVILNSIKNGQICQISFEL